jgi:hypothetical protein
MPFNRTTTVGGKKYLQLVESRWDPEKKQSRIHVIKHLGRVMEEDGKEKLIPSQFKFIGHRLRPPIFPKSYPLQIKW